MSSQTASLPINIETEDLHLLETIPIPGNPAFGTRYRWGFKGIRGGIKLETILIGNRRYTSTEAVARFVTALNTPKSGPTPEVTQGQRSRQTETARNKLEAAGVLPATEPAIDSSDVPEITSGQRVRQNRAARKKLEAAGVL